MNRGSGMRASPCGARAAADPRAGAHTPHSRSWRPPSAPRRQGTSPAAATVVAPFFLPQRRGHRGSSAGPPWVSSPLPVAGACAGDERGLFGGVRQPRWLRVWLTPCTVPRGDAPSWSIGGDAPPHGQLPGLWPPTPSPAPRAVSPPCQCPHASQRGTYGPCHAPGYPTPG